MPKITLPWDLLFGVGLVEEYFDQQSKNIWTIEHDEEGHHCPKPGCGALKKSCIWKLHIAFCCVVVGMDNGHSRFCGIRFGVTTPQGCSMHHYSDYDDNRFFQKAIKGLEYDLPPVFPHLQPGWEMVLPKLGRIRKPVTICVRKYMGELHYLQVAEPSSPGEQPEFIVIARISPKQRLLAGVEVKDDEPEVKQENVQPQKPEEVRSMAEREKTSDAVFNNPFSYQSYNEFYADTRKQAEIEMKNEKQKKVDDEAKAAAAAKGSKKLKQADGAKDVLNKKKGKGPHRK